MINNDIKGWREYSGQPLEKGMVVMFNTHDISHVTENFFTFDGGVFNWTDPTANIDSNGDFYYTNQPVLGTIERYYIEKFVNEVGI